MNSLDVLFLVAVLVPLLAGSARISLFGLGLQGFLLWQESGGGSPAWELGWLFNAVDYLLLRTLVGPALLYVVFTRPQTRQQNPVLPPSLFTGMVAVGLVIASFTFAAHMEPPGPMRDHVAVAAASLVMGFFVLATQSSPFSQVVAALRIENAVALFEVGSGGEHGVPAVRVMQLLVTACAVALYAWYLARLAAIPEASDAVPS